MDDYQKYLHPCALDESSPSIGRATTPSAMLASPIGAQQRKRYAVNELAFNKQFIPIGMCGLRLIVDLFYFILFPFVSDHLIVFKAFLLAVWGTK